MKILIVEDDLISRQVMKKMVEKYGECDIAVNGEEAVELYKNGLNEDEGYNVIFLDIMMPDTDGYSVLKKIRELEDEYDIAISERSIIVMTTALAESKHIIEAFREQCSYYLVKPIEKIKVEEILDDIKKQVR